jgi:hypothetical protein
MTFAVKFAEKAGSFPSPHFSPTESSNLHFQPSRVLVDPQTPYEVGISPRIGKFRSLQHSKTLGPENGLGRHVCPRGNQTAVLAGTHVAKW